MNDKPTTTQECRDLLAAARQGDDSSLWRLTQSIRPYLKGVVRKVLQDGVTEKLDESDVVQQVMATAVQKFDQFQGSSLEEWQAWLIVIARNEARNAARFWGQQRRDAHAERRLDTPAARELREDASSPSNNLIRREHAAEVLAALDRLKDDDANILRWRHFDGLTHGEIALRFGISEAAARQRWKTALDRLRKQIRRDE